MEPNIAINSELQTPVLPTQSPTPKKSLPKWPLIIAAVILMATLLTGGYVLSKNQNKQIGCTTEAKICPDGSSVGRTGPKCEFSACPKAPTPTPDPTANWKLFTAQSGVSFKYPSDWTPKEKITPKDSSGFGPIDGVTLTSPNGLVIAYGDHISGLGGGCDPVDCPYNHILKVEPVNIPGYGTLNLVELVVKDGNDSSVINAQVGLIDPKTYPDLQVGSKKQFGYYVMFNDKDPNKYLDEFHMYVYDSNSKYNHMGQLSNLNQYFTDPEVQTAEKIIKTLKFTDQTSQIEAIQSPTPIPTINEMASWKTYADVDYPFQIKYPQDWTLRTTYGASVKNQGNDRVAGIDINTGTPGYGSTLVVNVINPQGKTLEDWLKANMSNAYIPTKINYQGNLAYKYQYPTQDNRLDTIEIYYLYKNKIIFLAWNLISTVDQPTADQIMSSLKFTP
jgi:hypothetical protein